MTPAQVLAEHFENKVSLAPPQYMMINTMLSFYRFEQFKEYLNSSFKNFNTGDKFANPAFGPNVVSLIKSTEANSKPGYTATMVGDR